MEHNRIFLGLLLLFIEVCVAYSAATEEVKALVGSEVSLPCHVDTNSCGELHSVKFYRETSRIFVYSQAGRISRGEGDAKTRMNVEYTPASTYARLIIKSVEIDDEASYKCEITYLEVRENCDVVQMIKLSTLVKPNAVRISQDGDHGNSSWLGPYNEGTNIELKCEASGGRPIPKVTWYNNSDIIKSSYEAKEGDRGTGTGIAKLLISLTRADLKREFKCVVESDALDEPLVETITADVDVKPTGIQLSGVKSHVVQGSFVKLLCEVTGAKPAAEVKWFNGTHEVSETFINTINKEMNDGTFLTKSAVEFVASRYENSLAFYCEADNTVMHEQQDVPLRAVHLIEVYYPPEVIVSPPEITVIEKADTILLNCAYHSNPMKLEDAVWAKDGKNLTVYPPKFEGGTVDQLDLRINDVSREDHGNYTCICRNSVGSEESINHIFLNVQYPPTVELIIMEKMPIKAVDRKTITVACNIKEGNPQAISKVGWYLGGELLKELPECNYTSFDANGDGEGNGGPLCSIDSHILSLENVSESFAGNYTCMIKNLAGWGPMSPPQELIVYYPPSSARLKATSTNVIKKSSVTLLCSVDNPGKPDNVTYVWHRGTQLVSDITTYNWTINPVMYETKNKYTCYARNEGGDGDPASIFINVTAPPKFIDRLQPYNGILYTRDNISFTCRIECSPICNISWLKNGLQIPKNDPQYSFKETTYPPDPKKNDFESIESTLIFNMDQWPGKQLDKTAQNTVYTCQSSSNGIGSPASSDALVAVDYPPENLTVSKKIIDVQENSRPEIINCTGRGHPTLTYVWKNERNVNVSTNHILSLKPVNRADAGTYSCVASNKHGNTSAEVYLNVQYVPSCTLSLNTYKGATSLECIAKSNPEEVNFRFQIKNENETIDSSLILQDGITGYLPLDDSVETFRTYQCFVNNSVGVGAPCERDVVGIAPWWKQLFGDNLIIVIAALGAIIIIIIICIIIILICRRKRSNNKLPNQSSIGDKGGIGSVPPGGGTADPMGDPDKLFYENLPFHGMQNPPNKNAFYTLTTPSFKNNAKPPLPQQYSATVPHQKHIKLIPRSLFQEQQISKSKSFSSKSKPKKHFQIPLQKYHSFKFQTAESYFQPIKNIHEENLMRNGYASDISSMYRESHHNNYNHHKKDMHKMKGSFVIRRPNEYQENIQFQENMQNSVQLQYPQPVLASRSSVPNKTNGVVYADLDIAKNTSGNGASNAFLDSTLPLSKPSQKTKPKTEYATLKFNDVGQEIDV